MQWIEREPTYEFPYPTYYSSNRCLIEGRHYYCYFSMNDYGRWCGWIMSTPHHHTEAYIDAETKEGAMEFCCWFLTQLGGCDKNEKKAALV